MKTESLGASNANFIAQNKNKASEVLKTIAASHEDAMKNSANNAIADMLGSQILSYSQGIQNANEGIGMMQIADSAVSALGDGADKMSELSVRFNNAALSSADKSALQKEFSAIKESMSKTIEGATYNGKNVLSTNLEFETGGGSNVVANLGGVSANGLEITNSESIESFRDGLNSLSSTISGAMNAFASSIENSSAAISSASSSRSNLVDTDMANAASDYQNYLLKLDASILAKAHSDDVMKKNISALLG